MRCPRGAAVLAFCKRQTRASEQRNLALVPTKAMGVVIAFRGRLGDAEMTMFLRFPAFVQFLFLSIYTHLGPLFLACKRMLKTKQGMRK